MKLFSSTCYYYFVMMISIVAVSVIITTVHAQQQQQQQQTPSLPDGLYCGTTTKTQGLTTLMQIHGNLLSVLFTTYPGGDPRPPPRQCEMQFLLSHQYNTVSNPTLQNPNTVRWNLTKVLSEDSDSSSSSSSSVDSCAGMDITSPVLSFAPNSERQNALTLFFQVNGESGLTIEVSQSVCSATNPISPWIPSGYYCTNLADNVGISIGPKNSFEVDLLGIRIRGKITVNTQSGRMTIMAFGTDVTALFEVSQYNSTTGLVRLEGEYEGLEIAVSGGRAFCAKPDGVLNNTVNLIGSGSYCGTTQNDYIGLTLLEGHLFVLNYGGICSATGYYIESLNSQQQPQISFFFSQFSDCVQNVSITSATSSVSPYSSLSVSFFGGNTITPQTATLNLNQCENVPFSLLRNDIVPNGLYCLAPSFADQYLPGGTLGVAIFADQNANTTGRQRYQIWSGSCEAHGWFTVDGATGIVSLHEHVQHSSCPSTDQVEIVGAKWSAFRGAISVSVKYQSLVVTVSAKQGDCPRHTPSTVINSLPTGLYCNSSDKNFPSITVLGDMIDFAISDSCSAQGSYQVHTNGIVGVTLTALSNGCNDLFIHTLSFTAPTPLVPASFNFQGFYMNSSLNFKAVNCSHPARTNPIQMTTLCFQVADSSTAGVKHWGFALLGKSFGRFTLGACVINADFKVSKENQITDFAISSTTNECNGLKMQLVKFATDGSDAATISITNSNNNQINQQVTASRQCPTTLTTTITTSTTTLPPTTATSTTTSTTVMLPSTTPTTTTKQQQQSSSSTTAAAITGTSTASSAPTTTTTAKTTNPPPTTSTLPPTLPVGTYNFKTSNSLSGSLTVSPTQVVLAIGDCSEDGKLVAQTQDQNKYDFVPETQSSACSTTTKVSDVTFTQKTSSSSSSDNEISVTATINGQAYSAAAVQQDSNNDNNNSPSDSNDGGGSSIGPAVGGAIGGLLVLGVIGVLYMRKKNSSGSTGQDDNDGPRRFTQSQNRNAVNEEMLASAVSNYQNFDERFSTQGQNDNSLDI